MIYKPFKDLNISWLGMGNMRLPTTGERGPIDEQKAREIIEYAYHNGVNYFDTAFGYHGGESETFVGKVLSQFPRDTWYLNSKLPGHMMKYEDGKLSFGGYMTGATISSIAEVFEQQLTKCGVDYFDFYMLHNLCETSYDFYTNEELGVVPYLLEQKAAGRIRHLGFSAHGRAETIDKFLNHYKDTFEFVQIQINYMDWQVQEAGKKYEVITAHGIPVIAMEPVRGGRLASLTDESNAMLKAARPDDTIASWALRYLQSLDNMLVVLSGMSTMEQLKENIDTFSKNDPTTEAEKELLDKAVAAMMNRVPCTACRYCTDGCPQSLDIPKLISMYNELAFEKRTGTLSFTLGAMTEDELPAACIECGACTAICPQSIDIPGVMNKFAAALAK